MADYKPVAIMGADPAVVGGLGLPPQFVKQQQAIPIYIVGSDVALTVSGKIEPPNGVRQQRAIPVYIRGAVSPLGDDPLPPPSIIAQQRPEPWYIAGTNGVMFGQTAISGSAMPRDERATPVYIAGAAASVVSNASLPAIDVISQDPIDIFISLTSTASEFRYSYNEATGDTYTVFSNVFQSIVQRNNEINAARTAASQSLYTVSYVGDLSAVPAARYFGAAYSPEADAVYFAPMAADRVLKLNCADDSLSFVGDSLGAVTQKWEGAYLAEDGKIYCAPRDSADILVIDPSNDTTTLIATGSAGGEKWGSILGDNNGYLYFAPRSYASFMKLRLSDYDVDLSDDVINGSAFLAKGGGCMGPDGNLYFAQFYGPAAMHKVDVATRTISASAISAGNGNQHSALYPWSNQLRQFSFNISGTWLTNNGFYDFDTESYSFANYLPFYNAVFLGRSSTRASEAHVLLADGGVYGTASQDGNWLIRQNLYDFTVSTDDSFSPPAGNFQWIGGAAARGGTVGYLAPYNNTAVLKIALNEDIVPMPNGIMSSPFYSGGGK